MYRCGLDVSGYLYIVFTVHLIIIGRVQFYTNLCTQSYSSLLLVYFPLYVFRHI
jgi:hypothetical protein